MKKQAESNLKKVLNFFKSKKKKPEPQTFSEKLISWVKTIASAILIVMVINGLAIASFVVPTESMENTVKAGDFLFVNRLKYAPSTPQLIPFLNIPLPFLRLPGYTTPKKNDVIVFIFPGDRDQTEATEFQYYLKRCVATAGDTLEIRDKRLYVNGIERKLPEYGRFENAGIEPISDQWITFPEGRGYTKDNYGPVRIPKEGDVIQIDPQNLREWKIFIMREGHDVFTDGINVYVDGNPVKEYKVERDYVFGMGDNRDNSTDSRYFGYIPVENIIGSPLIVYWSWNPKIPITQLFDKIGSIRFTRIGKLIY